MRLYRTTAGRWAGTQHEATLMARADSDGDWEQVEVPTDKPGLLAWLNEHCGASAPVSAIAADPRPLRTTTGNEEAYRAETRRQISVEEEIQSCGWTRLATLASNVAFRFHELARDAEKRL